MFNGLYMLLYIIFGTNLLTGGPVPLVVFCLFQCFAEKEYQTESKPNETFGRVIFGKNVIQETWSGRLPPGRAPHPRGPLIAPPTYFLRIYILLYPENIREHQETLFPPPQPSVPVRSHLGAFSGAPPEGESIMEGFYINTIAPPMKCE